MRSAVNKLFLFLALLASTGLALAGQDVGGPGGHSVWTVYGFGNSQAIADVFRSVANFTNSGTFSSIFTFVAVAGILGVALTSGFSHGAGKKFAGYIVGVMLVSYLFTGYGSGGLTIKVEVIDTVDGSWQSPIDVPVVVGLPAAIISTAGFEITRQLESSFMLPDALKLSNGAPFNLAAALLSDASQARIMDSELSSSMAYYVQDCFTAGVASGALSASTLLSSTNFLADMKYENQALMVLSTLPEAAPPTTATGTPAAPPRRQPDLVNCTQAYGRILARIGDSPDAADYLNQASAWARTPAISAITAAADSVALHASQGAVSSGAAMIKQAAVLATFTNSYSTVAAATGNSDFLTALSMEQAKKSQFNSWVVGAELFNRTMGYIYAILQVFVYALAPLIFVAMLVPGIGASLLKSFGQVMMWIALWQPLLAIVNFVVLSLQQNDLGGVMNAGGGGFGITLGTMGMVSEKTANMRAAASVVGMMVPVLAWGIVKGAIDMTKFVATAGGEQFGTTAANTMTTGNYSLNQASMDSFTANKHSISQVSSNGGGYTVTDGVGSHKQELGASTVTVGGASANVSAQARSGTAHSSSISDGTTNTVGAQTAVSGGTSAAASTTANRSDTGNQSNSLVHNSSLAGSVSASGSLNRPGGGGGARGGSEVQSANGMFAQPGSPNYTGTGGADTINRGSGWTKVKDTLGKATPTLGAQVGGQMGTVTALQTAAGKAASTGQSGSTGVTGSTLTSATKGASHTQGATNTQSTDGGVTVTATAVGGLAARADANRQTRGEDSGLFGRASFRAKEGSEMHTALHGFNTAAMAQADAAAMQPNSIADDQKRLEAQVAARQAKDDTTIAKDSKEAKRRNQQATGQASAVIGAATNDVAGLKGEANTPLLTAVGDRIEKGVAPLVAAAEDNAKAMTDAVKKWNPMK